MRLQNYDNLRIMGGVSWQNEKDNVENKDFQQQDLQWVDGPTRYDCSKS